jgi:hypothetical protein
VVDDEKERLLRLRDRDRDAYYALPPAATDRGRHYEAAKRGRRDVMIGRHRRDGGGSRRVARARAGGARGGRGGAQRAREGGAGAARRIRPGRVEAFDADAWEQRIRDAQAAFVKALAAEPWVKGVGELQATRMGYYDASVDAASAVRAVRWRVEADHGGHDVGHVGGRAAGRVACAGRNEHADARDERDARRDAAARGETITNRKGLRC